MPAFVEQIWAWVLEHPTWLWIPTAVSVTALIGAAVALPRLVAALPADHFLQEGPAPSSMRRKIARNALGLVLAAAGLAMLVLPGQGLLTLLVGLALLDFPGRQRVIRALLKIPAVARGLQWIRKRGGKAPFDLPRGTDSP